MHVVYEDSAQQQQYRITQDLEKCGPSTAPLGGHQGASERSVGKENAEMGGDVNK